LLEGRSRRAEAGRCNSASINRGAINRGAINRGAINRGAINRDAILLPTQEKAASCIQDEEALSTSLAHVQILWDYEKEVGTPERRSVSGSCQGCGQQNGHSAFSSLSTLHLHYVLGVIVQWNSVEKMESPLGKK
jgi:hypothetical protein